MHMLYKPNKKRIKRKVANSKGVKVRGTGAATKGLYARGPMA